MKLTALILSILLFGRLCPAQEVVRSTDGGDQHLAVLADSVIKREAASFTMKGNAFGQTGCPRLTEIPLRNCTDEMVHLSLGSTYIHLYFKGKDPDKQLDSIFLVTHSHYWVRFPKDAFEGLLQANSCDFKADGKRQETFTSPMVHIPFVSLTKFNARLPPG